MARVLFSALALALPALAASAASPPPIEITRDTYKNWLASVDSVVSPFTDEMFDWFLEQQAQALPAPVLNDPQKLHVAVDRALRETIARENAGDVEVGNTLGFDAYGILDVPVAIALETRLFGWGKPVGLREGNTYPFDTVFSSRHDWLTEKWGSGNYFATTHQLKGGFVNDLRDRYTLLVRGNPQAGYQLFAAFLGPDGRTATIAHASIVILKPLPGGQTEFRQYVRQNGQSYKAFGLEYGRRNFGFNVARFRQGQKALYETMLELKNTGKIKENRP